MSNSKIVTIQNKHTEGCGTPPSLDFDNADYLSYFEDEYGEQHVFVYYNDHGAAKHFLADAGWEDPSHIPDEDLKDINPKAPAPARQQLAGVGSGLVPANAQTTEAPLEKPMELWLRSCLSAIQRFL